jgi:hypothetical protein
LFKLEKDFVVEKEKKMSQISESQEIILSSCFFKTLLISEASAHKNMFHHFLGHYLRLFLVLVKAKAVPQHTYGGSGGRGSIAPTHSQPQH